MGLFDLDEYKRKKARADESATPARAFPVAFADVVFDGRRQKLRFEPLLLDGGNVFISFRPESAGEQRTLMVGKAINSYGAEGLSPPAQQGLLVPTKDAFKSGMWLSEAVENVEKGVFGRLTVKELRESRFSYFFFGSNGTVDEEDYAIYLDGTMGRFFAQKSASFDPSPDYDYWAKSAEAKELLLRLDADEFAAYLEAQKEQESSVYGVSLGWRQVPFEEKRAMLPGIERDVESEVVSLMRAIVLSEPSLGRGATITGSNDPGTPLWRRPRFFVQPNRDEGEIFHFDKRFKRRIERFWPHVAAHFAPRFENVDWSEVHPSLLHWMNYRGAYLVEFTEPTAHEHLEARMVLHDFLTEKGVSLDKIDADR